MFNELSISTSRSHSKNQNESFQSSRTKEIYIGTVFDIR